MNLAAAAVAAAIVLGSPAIAQTYSPPEESPPRGEAPDRHGPDSPGAAARDAGRRDGADPAGRNGRPGKYGIGSSAPTGARPARPAEASRAEGPDGGDAGEAAPRCADCGIVASIQQGGRRSGPSWMSTIGDGAGSPTSDVYARALGPKVGASGGVFAARDLDRRAQMRSGYDIVVHMDSGGTRIVHAQARPALSAGDKVRVMGNQVFLR